MAEIDFVEEQEKMRVVNEDPGVGPGDAKYVGIVRNKLEAIAKGFRHTKRRRGAPRWPLLRELRVLLLTPNCRLPLLLRL